MRQEWGGRYLKNTEDRILKLKEQPRKPSWRPDKEPWKEGLVKRIFVCRTYVQICTHACREIKNIYK